MGCTKAEEDQDQGSRCQIVIQFEKILSGSDNCKILRYQPLGKQLISSQTLGEKRNCWGNRGSIKNYMIESSHHGSMEMHPTRNNEVAGSIPGLAQWVKDQAFQQLWCRLQTWLESGVAVALAEASSYISDQTPSPGTSICCGYGPKKKRKKKKRKKCMIGFVFQKELCSEVCIVLEQTETRVEKNLLQNHQNNPGKKKEENSQV